MLKRAFDFTAALVGLVLLSPLLAVLALWVKWDSPGPVFYRGQRVGKDGKIFHIFKFRSMVVGAAKKGPAVTREGDPRITRSGRFLRKTKLDELPQLLNVLRGEMSLVGPRPEDPRYVAHYTPEQRRVLSVRPGITGLASIQYRNEEALLKGTPPEQVDEVYIQRILPEKMRMELEYVQRRNFLLDVWLLVLTFFALFRTKEPSVGSAHLHTHDAREKPK